MMGNFLRHVSVYDVCQDVRKSLRRSINVSEIENVIPIDVGQYGCYATVIRLRKVI